MLSVLAGAFAPFTVAAQDAQPATELKSVDEPIDSVRNYLGFHAIAGYNRHAFQLDDWKTQGGLGVGLGINYKLRYKLFRLEVGAEAQYMRNRLKGDLRIDQPILYPSIGMTYHFDWTNSKEQQQVLSLVIPIMAGIEMEKWYLQAGVRIAFPLVSQYNMHTDITRSATDPTLIGGEFEDMAEHQLYTSSEQGKGSLALQTVEPMLALETGINLGGWKQPKHGHYELGLLAQVGLREYRTAPTQRLMTNRNDQVEQIVSTTQATDYKDTKMIPWFIGLKFTACYEIRKRTHAAIKDEPLPVVEEPVEEVVEVAEEEPAPQENIMYNGDTVHVGEKIVLQNLYFAVDKTEVLPRSQQGLDMLYDMLTNHPDIRVRIIGHTDNTNTAEYNQRLSEGRAQSVRQSMIRRGIAPNRMEAIGKGLTEPIDTNSTPEGRQNNRRVEIVVVED